MQGSHWTYLKNKFESNPSIIDISQPEDENVVFSLEFLRNYNQLLEDGRELSNSQKEVILDNMEKFW